MPFERPKNREKYAPCGPPNAKSPAAAARFFAPCAGRDAQVAPTRMDRVVLARPKPTSELDPERLED